MVNNLKRIFNEYHHRRASKISPPFFSSFPHWQKKKRFERQLSRRKIGTKNLGNLGPEVGSLESRSLRHVRRVDVVGRRRVEGNCNGWGVSSLLVREAGGHDRERTVARLNRFIVCPELDYELIKLASRRACHRLCRTPPLPPLPPHLFARS